MCCDTPVRRFDIEPVGAHLRSEREPQRANLSLREPRAAAGAKRASRRLFSQRIALIWEKCNAGQASLQAAMPAGRVKVVQHSDKVRQDLRPTRRGAVSGEPRLWARDHTGNHHKAKPNAETSAGPLRVQRT